MSVRDKVRESWLKRFESEDSSKEEKVVDVKSTINNTEKNESKKRKRDDSNVISLLSEDEDEEALIIEQIPKKLKSSSTEQTSKYPAPFKPIHNPLYDQPKLSNSITIEDLIGSPNITKSFLFSYQYSLQFLLPNFYSNKTPITILYQHGTVEDSSLRPSYNLSLIEVEMKPFSSHHPKLIINFYKDDTVKLFLLSANLTMMEFNTNNQFVWESPFLKRSTTTTSKTTQFKSQLIDWLRSYNKAQLNVTLINELIHYDFTSIIGDFIASTSGNHDKFGYLSLYQLLKTLNHIDSSSQISILYQSSSIGAPYSSTKTGIANIFTHILTPIALDKKFPLENGTTSLESLLKQTNTELFIVFPSEIDVRDSIFGNISGGWSHYNPYSRNGELQHDALKKYFSKSYSKQRGSNPSHTKYIIVSHDGFKTIEWVLFTSANLSKTAWGTKAKTDGSVNILNYETGILISRNHYPKGVKLIPVTIGEERILKNDEVKIELPFELPPKKYQTSDRPWCISNQQQ